MKNIFIAVPCMDQVPAQFCHSLSMLEKIDDTATAVSFNVGSLVYSSRNELARRALEMGADYVFWLDSDMVFDSDILKRCWALKDQADIISGLYFRRVEPYTPVLYDQLEFDENGACAWKETETLPDEPFEVAACGFGCVLMPTDIFIDVQAHYKTMFNPINGTGEDLAFCWRARQLGYKILVDPKLELGHVGQQVFCRAYFEAYKAQKNDKK